MGVNGTKKHSKKSPIVIGGVIFFLLFLTVGFVQYYISDPGHFLYGFVGGEDLPWFVFVLLVIVAGMFVTATLL